MLIVAFIIAIGVFAYLKFSQEDGWLCVDGNWVKHGSPASTMPEEGCDKLPELPMIPVTTDDEDTDEEPNITVDTPATDEEVSSPFTVTGQARVFESQFAYRLTDSDGSVLAEGNDMANAPDMGQFGPFEFEVSFTENSASGTLEVFSHSPKDGEEINKVTIPLSFEETDEEEIADKQTGETMTVKAFFMNDKLDPEITCQKVFSVERSIPKTKSVAKAAIEELLKGPTDAEKKSGYSTLINDGVILNRITIADGVASADFSEKLQENTGGSCRVGLIRRQIEDTLKQFSSIKEIIISINGNSEEILQP